MTADRTGGTTILGMGAIYLAVTLGMARNPALRRMDAGRA